jgi:hypothetical protein
MKSHKYKELMSWFKKLKPKAIETPKKGKTLEAAVDQRNKAFRLFMKEFCKKKVIHSGNRHFANLCEHY